MTEFETVIGLEVHAELLTQSKIFSGAGAHFGSEENSQVTPICLGMPGVLPVLNEKVVEFAIRAGVATNCEIAQECKFDRKHYFYPDLPKGYQISQYDQPIAFSGFLDIEVDQQTKRINLERIHMEEDAGKLVHAGSDRLAGSTYSLMDYNRAGVPLLELVSCPDLRSSEEAKAYMSELRDILMSIGVCDGKMEEGSMRCDANVSIRPKGQQELGQRVEIKNLNSLRSIQRAIDYEVKRQIKLFQNNEPIFYETRLWDENKQKTQSMRGKETEADYRYFPEPDLPLLKIKSEWIQDIKEKLPELPNAKRKRFESEYQLSSSDARLVVSDNENAEFFEKTLSIYNQPKQVLNWLLGDIAAYLNKHKTALRQSFLTPNKLANLIQSIENGSISGKMAKEILSTLLEQDVSVQDVIDKQGLTQISDESELITIIDSLIANNDKQVQKYLSGKTKVSGFFVGQVMRETKGKADPGLTNQLVIQRLDLQK